MNRRTLLLFLTLGVSAVAGQAACSNDDTVHDDLGTDSGTTADAGGGGGGDGGGGGGGGDGAPGDDCVKNPQTHEELLNACTDAVRIDKQPKLPLLLADGGLPSLP